jgi:hypothetical protein
VVIGSLVLVLLRPPSSTVASTTLAPPQLAQQGSVRGISYLATEPDRFGRCS